MPTMTETISETISSAVATSAPAAVPTPAARPRVKRFDAAQPVLEKLFSLYPHLFGQRFLPLKLGIFQDLMATHPDVFKRDDLKLALGVHTRSTRYLQAVTAGLPRHDLQGQVVEPVAPEHVFQSLVEVFTRRRARADEDLLPKLKKQLAAAYERSGLSRAEYLTRIGTPSEDISTVLDEAIVEVEQQRARQAALTRAFEGSGQTVDVFAASLGMEVSKVRAALKRSQEST